MEIIDYKQHWDQRYSTGGNSGNGSYGNSAIGKGKYISDVIKKFKIKTINDLGHGDGNQLKYFEGDFKYYGYDVSSYINSKLANEYKDNPKYTFLDSVGKMNKGDLALSLDVIYHIIQEDEYYKYLDTLFSLGDYVLIYAVDMDHKFTPYFQARKFTPYIDSTFPQFKLLDVQDGFERYVKFYLYGKE